MIIKNTFRENEQESSGVASKETMLLHPFILRVREVRPLRKHLNLKGQYSHVTWPKSISNGVLINALAHIFSQICLSYVINKSGSRGRVRKGLLIPMDGLTEGGSNI